MRVVSCHPIIAVCSFSPCPPEAKVDKGKALRSAALATRLSDGHSHRNAKSKTENKGSFLNKLPLLKFKRALCVIPPYNDTIF